MFAFVLVFVLVCLCLSLFVFCFVLCVCLCVCVYISHISIGPGLCHEDDFSQPILKSGTNFFDDGDTALLMRCKIHQTTFKRKA